MRAIAVVAALLMVPTAATAQDSSVMGNVNPVDYTGAIALGSAAEADAQAAARTHVTRRTNAMPLSRKSVRTCQQVPTLAARLGARNPDIVRLTELCRQAGFRY